MFALGHLSTRSLRLPREQPAEGSQDGTVDRSVRRSAMEPALEDAHLVAEDNQLDVLVYVVATEQDNKR